MTSPQSRRVRRLRLSAPQHSLLSRGRLLLEDALRTATLPGEQTGRLLLVRSLKIGRIGGHQSPASLALTVERAFQQQCAQAVHAEVPAAGQSTAVYFNNDAEPFICLALRLARSSSVSEWFWPVAVPGWQPNLARDDALRLLLYSTLRTRAGVIASVKLVRDLYEAGVISELLSAVRWQDGVALLRACGWAGAGSATAFEAPPVRRQPFTPATRFKEALAQWQVRWGAYDARTNWLAAITLLMEKPARLEDPQLIKSARQLIASPELSSEQPSHSAGNESVVRQAEAAGHAILQGRPLHTSTTSPEPTASQRTPSSDAPAVSSETRRRGAYELQGESGEPPSTVKREVTDNREALSDGDERARITAEACVPDVSAPGEITDSSRKHGPAPWSYYPRETNCAGLLFLVPILSRLGIGSIMKAQPSLIECNLPERLLRLLGLRLRLPDNDPMISWLVEAASEPAPEAIEFLAPASWRSGLCSNSPHILSRMRERPGTRVLSDGSGRLPLGLWHREPSLTLQPLLREWVGNAQLKRGSMPPEADIDILLQSWLVAARRWCRRFAYLGLSDLICRRGRVCVTRTHIDVLFDYRQADLRVRRVGLDINPGWVAWLGRVVTFHYLFKEMT